MGQIGVDFQTSQYHYELVQQLKSLREKRVLIIGSGNIVHNLRMIAWDKLNTPEFGFDWAIEANEKMKKFMLDSDHKQRINFRSQGKAFDLAIPTPEHYLSLQYFFGIARQK